MTDTANHTAADAAAAREAQEANARHARRKAAKRQNAAARQAHVASIEGTVDRRALRDAMQAYLAEHASPVETRADTDADGDEPLAADAAALAAPAPLVFPVNDTNRWVPIGPSAVRQGQAEGRPRVSGRVRALAVSPNGQRIYAGTAKGGVWYSGDAGATWEPIGGWANEPRVLGGHVSAFSCGSLLVAFGGSVATDFVMAGTGEIGAFTNSANAAPMGGLGILAGLGPADP
uniref:hypothetical protein n=1 Tax=Ilumatobacter nonamiensis TaxID=467093 RepID=UPI00058DC87A